MRLKGALMIRKALSKYCNDTRQRHDGFILGERLTFKMKYILTFIPKNKDGRRPKNEPFFNRKW